MCLQDFTLNLVYAYMRLCKVCLCICAHAHAQIYLYYIYIYIISYIQFYSFIFFKRI